METKNYSNLIIILVCCQALPAQTAIDELQEFPRAFQYALTRGRNGSLPGAEMKHSRQ